MLGKSVKTKLIEPKLRKDLIPFLDAFNTLTKDRQISEITGYIPYTSIVAYANENEFKGVLRLELFYLLNRLDNLYVKSVNG